MLDRELEFAYASRRARQEEVAAINARGEAAAVVHRKLSRLYATRALMVLLDPDLAVWEESRPADPAGLTTPLMALTPC